MQFEVGERLVSELERLTGYLAFLNTEGADLRRGLPVEGFDPSWQPAVNELNQFVGHVVELLCLLDRAMGRLSTREALQALQVQQLTAIINGQNADLQELSQNAAEVAAGVSHIAEDAHQVAGAAAQMSHLGGENLRRLQDVLGTMKGLDGRARGAHTAVETLVARSRSTAEGLRQIEGVASTSKLLALNAAIQAAHANDRAFAVVAQEMRRLADRTAGLVRQIAEQVKEMEGAAAAAGESVRSMSASAAEAGAGANEATSSLDAMKHLIESMSGSVQSIAAVTEEQAAGTEAMTGAAELLASKVSAAAESLHLTRDQAVSGLFEQVHMELGRFRIGSGNEAMRDRLEGMASEVEAAIEQLIDRGTVRLEELWETDYREIRGGEVRRLRRLFNVDRVPPSGFVPPKYLTSYDERIDQPLIEIMDRADRPGDLVFSTVLDLNGFCLAQPHTLMRDWTGDPELDLKFNRIKRLVTDPISRQACRVALPATLVDRERITRADLERSGVLSAPRPEQRPFLLQTYALDTGVVVLAMAMPLYVKERRWGTVRIGYRPATAESARRRP